MTLTDEAENIASVMDASESNQNRNFSEKLVAILTQQPWATIVIDLWKLLQEHIQRHFPKDSFEVLEYESTLELKDPVGKHALFTKREKVRYLQDNIIAYQDQAWGDGDILINYRCTPGTPVDRYRLGYKTHILISRRAVRNRGDVDEFNIEWDMREGFLRTTEQWETHVKHPTKYLKINIIFPHSRPPRNPVLIESNQQRSHSLEKETSTQLPDGRWQITWQTDKPRLYESYIVQWEW